MFCFAVDYIVIYNTILFPDALNIITNGIEFGKVEG